MKYFAFVALFMMLAIQAFALPAAPAPASVPKAEEIVSQPQRQVYEEAHTGAAKDKRGVLYSYYTTSAIVPPYPTLYRYSYVPSILPPVYPALPSTFIF